MTSSETECRRMLHDLAADLAARFDAVRLPIHILLENRFGELNENQEEMLEAARVAAEGAGEAVRRLRELAELELGLLAMSPARQRTEDVFRSVVAAVTADAERAGLRLTTVVEPPLPAIRADAARVREALTLLVSAAIRRAAPNAVLRFAVRANGPEVAFHLDTATPDVGLDTRLATALLAAQNAYVVPADNGMAIVFPVAAVDRLEPLISVADA